MTRAWVVLPRVHPVLWYVLMENVLWVGKCGESVQAHLPVYACDLTGQDGYPVWVSAGDAVYLQLIGLVR